MANAINRKNIEAIPERSYIYDAIISGDFKEHLYPNEVALELKVGAQVMFIRNDSSELKRYFNGLLAKVSYLDNETVKVIIDGETEALTIEREVWENKKYFVDSNKKIQEDIVGRYEQFPFRLAWAVTIHKSQGLTFDRLIIDAGKSFTSGQVYVALSRCRTLQGIILKSRITPAVILTDDRIASFQKETNAGERIVAILEEEKNRYAVEKLLHKLDVLWLKKEIENWSKAAIESRFLDDENIEALIPELYKKTDELIAVYKKFSQFVQVKTNQFLRTQDGWELIEEKSAGAVNFFFENVHAKIFNPLKEIYAGSKGGRGLKGYNDILKTLLEELEEYLSNLKEAMLLDKALYIKKENDRLSLKVEKKPSHLTSFQLFENGQSPAEIAAARGITTGTVLSHLAKIAAVGVLDINRLFSAESINTFKEKFVQHQFESVTEGKSFLPESFTYDEIRILLNHFKYLQTKNLKL